MFSPTKKKLKAVGINIYGGGFTLGVLKYFEVVGQWEEIRLGARTFDLNFAGIPRPLSQSEWPVKEFTGKVDLVYANPPCVPWSDASSYSTRTNPGQIGRSGKTTADRFNDPLLMLTDSTMRTALRLRPRVFISESVENAYNVGVSHYEPYKQAWRKAGYAVTYFLTDALLHGAPCRRRRFHFIAHDCRLLLGAAPNIGRATTVRDAIGDLVKVKFNKDFQHVEVPVGNWNKTDEYRHILKLVPPFGRLAATVNQLESFCGPRPSTFVQRLRWDTVSGTVLRFGHKIHPDGNRWITFREGLRLLTYPDDFYAHNEIDAADSVLPAVSTFLAGVARRSIQYNEGVKPEFNVVDWRPLGTPWHGHK